MMCMLPSAYFTTSSFQLVNLIRSFVIVIVVVVVVFVVFDLLPIFFQLHQLLPAVLTMVVAQRLSSKSFDNHWILRYEAALCLVQACNL